MIDTSGFDIKLINSHDNDYQLLRIIHESQSGFCRIWEVKHAGRLYIAKTLKPEFRGSLAHEEILNKEFEILSSIYHPSVIQAYEIVQIEEVGRALILEYAYGVTLQTYLDSKERDQAKILSILEQICSAIDYCHKRGIIHRDLKPANIMVYPQGPIVKIIDFNLSHSPSYVSPPLPGGTVGFSAPEEFKSDAPADPASDIWSIGKLMEMLLPKGNRQWLRVAKKCLAPVPEDRPATALMIPVMLKEKEVSKGKIALASLVFIGLIGILIFIFNLINNKENVEISKSDSLSYKENTSNGLTATLPSDSTISSLYENLELKDVGEMSELSKEDDKGSDPPASLSENSSVHQSASAENSVVTNETGLGDLMSLVKTKSETAAKSRFKEQLAILDTATHQHTFSLAKAGHWRWKAKQDIVGWLNSQSLSHNEKMQLRTAAEVLIDRYGEAHQTEVTRAIQDAFLNRQVSSVLKASIRDVKLLGGQDYLINELDEDGQWKSHIERRE